MKIWIDLCNSPHVIFFARLIRELARSHELVLTCRPLANTVALLDLHGFSYHIVGRHYGASNVMKVIGFFVRTYQLFAFLRSKGIGVAVSHSSFYSPLVARLLGARSIYINDNEHAQGNNLAFPFADRILIPEAMDIRSARRQNARGDKIIRYPGVKEGIYAPATARPPTGQGPTRKETREIFVRPEPWTAQYYNGHRNFMDQLLLDLQADERLRVVLLPRGEVQERHYRQASFRRVQIPSVPLRLEEIAARCDLFIGAGGTMTREAAVLGIPTISVYQGPLLDVDRYLIRKGLMVHQKKLTSAFVRRFLNTAPPGGTRATLLAQGEQAYALIKQLILGAPPARREAS